MKLLLDTQLAVWWQIDSRRVPAAAREAVAEADAVYMSRASLWELAIKAGLGRLNLDLPRFSAQLTADGFRWLEIAEAHVLALGALPVFEDHKDPFDRLLVAQSLSEPLILLTADRALARYGSTVRLV